MLRVTWAWIGSDELGLDLANTIAVVDGADRDLLTGPEAFERWASAAVTARELPDADVQALVRARESLLLLRDHVHALVRAAATGEAPPAGSVAAVNEAAAAAPVWPELRVGGGVALRSSGRQPERILAAYARSAIALAAGERGEVRVCPAPSCGMFFRPQRAQQRWCSQPCGNRARFARHYRQRGRR